ncbi:MAG: sensor histidine kinase, partial [Clostridia bacterium]|nr:sensor histidine kinase [Clostridia bacterium]
KTESLYYSWTGELQSGEKVMAYTNLIKNDSGQIRGAVRYITSLENIHSQLVTIYLLIAFVFLIMVSLVIF